MITENIGPVQKKKRGGTQLTRLLMSIWETSGEQISFPGKCKIFTTSNGWLLSKVDFLILLFLCELLAFQ